MLSAARARPVLRVDAGADLAGHLDVLAGGDPQGADSGVRRPDVPVTGPGRVTLLVDADAEEAEPAGRPGPGRRGVRPRGPPRASAATAQARGPTDRTGSP